MRIEKKKEQRTEGEGKKSVQGAAVEEKGQARPNGNERTKERAAK